MKKTIGIVQINDTHANLLPHGDIRYTGEGFKVEILGGYPRIMTKIKEFRNKHLENLLVFDNGDTFHGTYEAVNSKGEVMLPYLNALGINAMTFHWDIAYTPKHLIKLGESLNYPILAANVYHEGTKDLMFSPTHTLEIDGIKIGIIGLASNIIRKNMPKPFWEGADFTNGIEEAAKYSKILLDEGTNLIILLSHLGYPQDIELLNQVPNIDICLSGHTHNRIRTIEKVNESYIIQSGALASSIGYLQLTFEDKKLKNVFHEYIVLDKNVEEDLELLNMINEDKILSKYKDYLDEEVGESFIDLHRGSSLYGTMDYFLLDAIRDVTGLNIAFSNGWRYGGAIERGKLTRRDLYKIVPMNPPIMTVEMTGEEICQMLEDNLEKTFSVEPFQQMGGYIKRNSGLKVYWKIENPKNHRIQRVFVGNEELELEKIYKIAYITRQGVPEIYGKNHKEFGMDSIKAMEKFLKKSPYNRKDLDSYIPV